MAVPRRIQVIAAFAALYLIWGSTYLGILFAIQSIPPFLMAGARFLFAGGIMYAAPRWQGAPRPTAGTWKNSLIIGGLLFSCGGWAPPRCPKEGARRLWRPARSPPSRCT